MSCTFAKYPRRLGAWRRNGKERGMLCDRKIPSRGVRPLGCATSRLSAPRAEAARVHRVASGRSTRSARRLGDTEIGFEVGLHAASPTGEGREMIGLSYWSNGRYSGRRSHIGLCQTCACAASAFRRRTRQARPSRFVHLLALARTMKPDGMLQRCVQASF